MDLGQFLKKKRKEAGLTQLELAKKLNITERQIRRYEKNEGFTNSNSQFLRLTKILEIDSNDKFDILRWLSKNNEQYKDNIFISLLRRLERENNMLRDN